MTFLERPPTVCQINMATIIASMDVISFEIHKKDNFEKVFFLVGDEGSKIAVP